MHSDDIRTERGTVYLGRDAEGAHVYADIRLTTAAPDRRATFTDHTEGPYPVEVAVTFTVLAPRAPVLGGRRHPNDVSDGWWWSVGASTPSERGHRVTRYAIPAADAEAVLDSAEHYHLNTMRAACVHMTSDMLTPTEADDVPVRYGAPDVQGWRLDHVTCPETGYRYGHAWLAEAAPATVLDALRRVISAHDIPRGA